MFACVYVCVPSMCMIPEKARRVYQILWFTTGSSAEVFINHWPMFPAPKFYLIQANHYFQKSNYN